MNFLFPWTVSFPNTWTGCMLEMCVVLCVCTLAMCVVLCVCMFCLTTMCVVLCAWLRCGLCCVHAWDVCYVVCVHACLRCVCVVLCGYMVGVCVMLCTHTHRESSESVGNNSDRNASWQDLLGCWNVCCENIRRYYIHRQGGGGVWGRSIMVS